MVSIIVIPVHFFVEFQYREVIQVVLVKNEDGIGPVTTAFEKYLIIFKAIKIQFTQKLL